MLGKKTTGRKISKFDYVRLEKLLNYEKPGNEAAKFLKNTLRNAKLVEPTEIRPSVVTMNTTFRLENLGNGKNETYTLVFPEESDPRKHKLSILDPLGCAIFAHEVGDVLHWNSCSDVYYLIKDIVYQPEAAGDYHR